jgi:squalene synthase HpnC
MDLTTQLKLWGPRGSSRCDSLAEAQAYCRALAQSHYENFSVISWLFPRHLRQHLANVYAYCRWADDLADEMNEPQEALRLLAWWEEQLNDLSRASAKPTHPVFIALADTIRSKRLPLAPFRSLLVAFRQDQVQTHYESWEELEVYCRHSADPVGELVLHLSGSASAEKLRLSAAICTGLQLINFCQDVRRDYEKGRIYLPRSERATYGWTDDRFAELAESQLAPDESFRRMLKVQVDRSEKLLRLGSPLTQQLEPDFGFPVRAFVRGGLAIAEAIRRQRYDVWTRRPVIGKWRRAVILLRAWLKR